MSTSARMLQLLSLLQTHRYWPGPELSGRLDVSPRTLRRDVERLRDLGYPVDATRGAAGGYQLRGGAAMPPLLLEDEEAVAIAVGLRTAAAGAVAGIEETSVRALGKVVQVMPPRPAPAGSTPWQAFTVPGVRPDGGAVVDPGVLTLLAQACRDDERVRFAYVARDGSATERDVEPHRLVSLGRRWYLVGYDLDRADWRTFRLDRLSDPRATGARFRQRELPAEDAAAFVRASARSAPRRHEVVVRFDCAAADVERHVGPWGDVTGVDDDPRHGCELRMHVDELDWPVHVLAAVGRPFTVLGPPELTDQVAATARLFAASA